MAAGIPVGALYATLALDRSKFDSGVKGSKGLFTSLADVAKKATVVIATALGAALAIGKQVFDVGAKFEAMDAKAQTVFGESLGVVEKWAATSAAAMGLTRREATGLAANLGDLLVPMGMSREQAAEMSTDIIGLSGALSEWSGGTRTAAEVAVVLQKSLLGERDGLKELGISITEADVSARLLKNGQDALTGSALEQAKALATQQLLFEKTTDAQAAYAAGTAEGIRVGNEMSAMFAEMVEGIITALYPAVITLATGLRDMLGPAIQAGKDLFEQLRPELEAVFAFVQEHAVPIATALALVIAAAVVPAIVSMVLALAPLILAVGAVVAAVAILFEAWESDWGGIRSFLEAVWKRLQPIFAVVVKWLGDTIPGVVAFLGNLFGRVFGGIAVAVKASLSIAVGVFDVAAGAIVAAASFVTDAWQGLTGFFTGLWKGIGNVIKGGINFVIDLVNGMIRHLNGIQIHIPGFETPFGVVARFDWPGLGLKTIPRLAGGDRDWMGGFARMNERGPETVFLPRHSAVAPAGDSETITAAARLILSGGGGRGGPLIGSQNIYGVQPGDVERETGRALRRAALRWSTEGY